MERNGIEIRTQNEIDDNWDIVFSNDNTLYRNKTEIVLK